MNTTKIKSFLFTILVVAMPLFFVQCSGESNEMQERYEQEKEELIDELSSLRDDINDQLDDLNNRISDAANEENAQDAYDELTEERSEVEKAISDIENSSRENWEQVKSESQEILDTVSDKLEEWREEVENLFDWFPEKSFRTFNPGRMISSAFFMDWKISESWKPGKVIQEQKFNFIILKKEYTHTGSFS